MTPAGTVDIQEFINSRRLSGYQLTVLVLCFLVVAVDGFDTAAVGYIAPALRAQWQVTPPQLAPLFGAGLFGLMAGAFIFGPLADKVGRRAVLIFATAAFGLASVLSATATSIEMLTFWRFVTGIGLGGAMPSAITLTSEYCPERNRSLLVMAMFCGFTLGGALGGLSAAALIADFGWQGVLVLGGVMPLVLAVVLLFVLPESVRYLVLKGGQDARVAAILRRVDPSAPLDGARFVGIRPGKGSPVRQLFAPGLAAGTLLLWTTFFMSLLVFYLLTSWLPTLLNGSGQTVRSASLIALMLPIGSTVGAIGIGLLMDRLNPHAVLAGSYALAAAFILLLGASTGSTGMLVLAVFGAGVGTGGSQIGINALAAAFYPTASRATGVSWANAVGRTGSVLGSMVGGQLLAMGWSLATVFSVAAIPAAIAALAILAKGRVGRVVPAAVPAAEAAGR
ncbi:aromatic acid/H+ symport family MFS transporter [Roseomonas sp. NAR14]|uniref:Aromatic acid/H+ symport family MFS transporter n=1 Tax=Roseomonas acroporae TaxID=2937791 RepID=A0A9X1Y9D7_9PROT|nr:aromatic acid/H+ symport family MFS transporter [Roseomonas acroporae]MCK8786309.1 aromatic acid/H+ symport family MFS transporter [Roseomonas acroporae]